MQRSMFLQRCYLDATGNYARKCRRCWIVVVFWSILYVSVGCIGVLRVNTYIHTHAHAKTQRRTSIFSSFLVPLASPSSVGTGFKGGRYYIWLPGTAHLVYAPCLTQQGRKRPSYSQKRFLAEDLVCCQYHSYEILPASDSLSRIFRSPLKRAAQSS